MIQTGYDNYISHDCHVTLDSDRIPSGSLTLSCFRSLVVVETLRACCGTETREGVMVDEGEWWTGEVEGEWEWEGGGDGNWVGRELASSATFSAIRLSNMWDVSVVKLIRMCFMVMLATYVSKGSYVRIT